MSDVVNVVMQRDDDHKHASWCTMMTRSCCHQSHAALYQDAAAVGVSLRYACMMRVRNHARVKRMWLPGARASCNRPDSWSSLSPIQSCLYSSVS